MTNLKNTQTIRFQKEVSIDNNSTNVIIDLEFGINKRGETFRQVNQLNTANFNISEAERKFDMGLISLEDMIKVIESEGFTRN